MTPQISGFIPGLLEYTNTYIEVVDEHHVTANQKGQVQIKYVAITEILSFRHFKMYFWKQIYTMGFSTGTQ